jgi:methylmalonyl-CoA/ethylmalonyl-CoA epimerase
MVKIEHIGIAVKDLASANEVYKKLMGYDEYKTEAVESEGVKTSFFMCGESKIELLEGTTKESAITKFVEKRGEGIHHIAFAVDDIHSEIKRLEKEGFIVLNKEPKRGADNKWVVFLHPKSANGVLVELCQDIEPSVNQ